MSFKDTRFPTNISYGSSGGPGWKTGIIVLNSGHEQRIQNWEDARYRFDVAYGVRQEAHLKTLIAFFQEMRGSFHSFRYQDYMDYEASAETLTVTGGPTVQLTRTYGSTNPYVRDITLPVSTITMEYASAPYVPTSVNYSTGVVTLSSLLSDSITAITKANPGVVTCGSHPFTTGEELYLSDIGGMTELNGSVVTITKIDADTFSIGVDTSSYTTYTSGGSAAKYPQTSGTLTWTGEFDVHCRFEQDTLLTAIESYQVGSAQVPLVEVRS